MSLKLIKSVAWSSSTFACEVALNGVGFQANSFGPMLETTNVMVRAEDLNCPFAQSDPESDA